MLRRLALILGLIFACASAPVAAAGPADVQTTWQLLDYLAVDYGGAVRDGKVVSASEYSEMREFSASAADKIAGLPAKPAKAQLVAESKRFKALIEAKASLADVATAAHALGQHLLTAYPVPLGPRHVAGPRPRRALVPGDLRRVPWRQGRRANRDGAAAQAAADRVRRSRAGETAHAVRIVPGDQPGARRHGDAKLRAAA